MNNRNRKNELDDGLSILDNPASRKIKLIDSFMNKSTCFRNAEQGLALVETALVLPLLLVMVFAVMEFGAILYNKSVLTTASREAARTAVMIAANAASPITDAKGFDTTNQMPLISAAAMNNASFLVGKGAVPSVGAPVKRDTVGTKVEVTVSYEYPTIVLSACGKLLKILFPTFDVSLLKDSFTIKSKTAMYFQ